MALANIVCIADSGTGASNSVKTSKAASTLVAGRPGIILANVGDTMYPQAATANEPHVTANFWFSGSSFTKANSIATPGNHDNGAGGTAPDVNAYLDVWAGTLAKVTGVTPYPATGVPNTDQFIDVGGWRLFFMNSGAIETVNPIAGWPIPHKNTFDPANARVVWLRNNWAPGLKNIVFTHHLPYSVWGNHHDNPNMDNLWNEMKGHACMMIGGHDHNMQIFTARDSSSGFPGIVEVVCGGSEGHYTGAATSSNQRSLPSWLQFANDTTLGFGLLEILSATQIRFSMYDQNGALMTNTAALGSTGAPQVTVDIGTIGVVPTYQYSLDGAAYVSTGHSGADKVITLGALGVGQHSIKIRDSTPGPDAQYTWEQTGAKPTSPVLDSEHDGLGAPIVSGGHTTDSTMVFTWH